MTSELNGDYICNKKVFYTEEGTFEDVKNIVAFGKDEILDDPVEVHRLLENPYKLFVPGYSVDMKWYGCRVIDSVQERMFQQGLKNPASFGIILDWGINGVWFGVLVGYTVGGLIAIVYAKWYLGKIIVSKD